MKKAFDLIGGIVLAVVAVITAVEHGATEKADGAAKKAEALAKVTELVSPSLPGMVQLFLPTLLGFLIDAAVSYANTQGFFD